MADLFHFLLILFPFGLAIFLLVVKHWKANITGFIVWILVSLIAVYFSTPLIDIVVISFARIVDYFKITLMVGASICMITYMGESGALKRMKVILYLGLSVFMLISREYIKEEILNSRNREKNKYGIT